ncbi:7330_t:CDS:2, partial [Racocetra fulgida]
PFGEFNASYTDYLPDRSGELFSSRWVAGFDINESEDAGIVGEITIYLPDEITDIPIINGV